MARELPGFYFDSEKNRYFPIPKRGAAAGKGIPADGKRPQLSSDSDQDGQQAQAVEPRLPPSQHSLLQRRQISGAVLPDMRSHSQRLFTTRCWESQFRDNTIWGFDDGLSLDPTSHRMGIHDSNGPFRYRLQGASSFLNLDLGGKQTLLLGTKEGLLLLEKRTKWPIEGRAYGWTKGTCILRSREDDASTCSASENSEGASQRIDGLDSMIASQDAVEEGSSEDLEYEDDFRHRRSKRRRSKTRGIWRNSERGLERIDEGKTIVRFNSREEGRRSEALESQPGNAQQSNADPGDDLECPVQLSLPDFRALNSPVTALRAAKRTEAWQGQQRFIATSFGCDSVAGSLYLLQGRGACLDLRQLLVRSYSFIDESIWTGEISDDGTRAVAGGSSSAFRIDLESGVKGLLAPSNGSATLAQQFDSTGTVVLSGFRNGAISTVDLRAPLPVLRPLNALPPYGFGVNPPDVMHSRKSSASRKAGRGATIASHATPLDMGSSVCDIGLLRTDENYLLAGTMNGSFLQWDRRSARAPVRRFLGHVNSHTLLKMAVDPREKIVTSGGEDCLVRIWSLSSGELLQRIGPLSAPITALEWASPDFDSRSWGLWMGGQGLMSGPLLATPF